MKDKNKSAASLDRIQKNLALSPSHNEIDDDFHHAGMTDLTFQYRRFTPGRGQFC